MSECVFCGVSGNDLDFLTLQALGKCLVHLGIVIDQENPHPLPWSTNGQRKSYAAPPPSRFLSVTVPWREIIERSACARPTPWWPWPVLRVFPNSKGSAR